VTPEKLRADMPALSETVYLNTGASGPSPRRVVEAAEAALETVEYEAPGGEGPYPAAGAVFDEARAAAAAHVGADPADVALTGSTTHGIGRLVTAMDWTTGDVVVRTDTEHAAGVFPCDRLHREHGVEERVLETEDGRIDREAYAAAVADAKLVVFSSLTWTHGTRVPVADLVDIAHDAGARVLVDAVQSVGQHPVDVEAWGADAVAAAGHKWLLAPWGAGFLYVDPAFAEDLVPQVVGYRSVVDGDAQSYELRPGAGRFEAGTSAVGPYAGLVEGVDIVEELGYDTIEDRVERLTDRLKTGIDDERLRSPDDDESGLVSFQVDDPDATVERLAEAGVQVRALPLPETVRASVHVFNTADDVDALLDAL
jgi:selenocysteine lyase/cysteine desulfurase